MLDLFLSLIGDVSGYNQDLVLVLSAVFLLLLLSEFYRFFELMIDYVFRRKK